MGLADEVNIPSPTLTITIILPYYMTLSKILTVYDATIPGKCCYIFSYDHYVADKKAGRKMRELHPIQ